MQVSPYLRPFSLQDEPAKVDRATEPQLALNMRLPAAVSAAEQTVCATVSGACRWAPVEHTHLEGDVMDAQCHLRLLEPALRLILVLQGQQEAASACFTQPFNFRQTRSTASPSPACMQGCTSCCWHTNAQIPNACMRTACC